MICVWPHDLCEKVYSGLGSSACFTPLPPPWRQVSSPMCDFWQAGISSKHIIWHFLPSLGKQINQVETNLHGLVPVVSVVFINVILNTTHAIKPLVILTLPM